MKPGPYENFPARVVLLSSVVSISIYAFGAFVLGKLGLLFALAYVLYCLWCEVNVLRGSCVHCYYYGKVCGLGKGKLCAWLLRRGDPRQFVEREVSWREIAPDMLVLLFPLVGGVIVLIRSFAWPLVLMLIALAALSLGGNALVRGSFTCKYCKQRELGCPAEKLFSASKTVSANAKR